MQIGTYSSVFRDITIAADGEFLCGLQFGASKEEMIEYFRKYKVGYSDGSLSSQLVSEILNIINDKADEYIPIFLMGTTFQIRVWKEISKIPFGTTRTYQEIANNLHGPNSVRAVANAIGANPIAVIVPCHRVIRTDGSLGGYRWGTKIKQDLLDREKA